MNDDLRNLVRSRAGNRCEYCRIHQDADPLFAFHIEHVIARQHGGGSSPDNLALACHPCNLHKGPNLAGIDPQTGKVVTLFNPRTQVWSEHFEFVAAVIRGHTSVGRATIRVLVMNDPIRVRLRSLTKSS